MILDEDMTENLRKELKEWNEERMREEQLPPQMNLIAYLEGSIEWSC